MIYQHGLAVVIYGLSLTEIILNTIIQSTIVIFVNHQLTKLYQWKYMH